MKTRILSALDYIRVSPDDFNLSSEYFDNNTHEHITGIHGVGHIYRVMIHSALIAKELNVCPRIGLLVYCAAFLHDLSRTRNGKEPNHGANAAMHKFNLFKNIWDKYNIAENEADYIRAAVWNHCSHGHRHNFEQNDKVNKLLRDADALDRQRFMGSARCNPGKLNYKEIIEYRPVSMELLTNADLCAPPFFYAINDQEE